MLRTARALVWILGLTAAALAHGQSAPGPYTDREGLPDDPQSARIRALLDAVNSGQRDRLLAFFKEHVAPSFREQIPDEEHASILLAIHRSSTGFDLHGLRHYDPPRPPTNRTVIVRNRLLDSWEAFVLEFEPDPPHRIAGIGHAMARPPAGFKADEPLSLDQAMAELKTYLDRLAGADALSGTTLVAKDGKVVFTHVCGQASKAFNAPNRLDTKFNLGSMNKMITAVAVAQLVEAGKLSFDDTVDKHLGSDWISPEAAAKIRISHLLSHTSGLGSHFTEKFWQSSRALYRELDDFKPLVADQTPAFEPGTDWAYSNSGFLLAGAIIEKVSGQSYFEYVREHICGPAGMTNTDCYEMDLDTPNLAIGYSSENGPDGQPRWVNNVLKHVVKGGPAGGGFSTVEDLLRFDQALRSGKLVSSRMLEVLWSPKPASPGYGYGFSLEGDAGQRIVGHGGGFPGISSNLDMFLDQGYTVATLSNYDDGGSIVTRKCREILARVK